ATQLHWPSNRETWPGERLIRAEKVYLKIIGILQKYEPILLLVDPSVSVNLVKNKIEQGTGTLKNIHIYSVPVNDVWARDCGPIIVRKKSGNEEAFVITDWEYNAWGEKYPPFDADNRLPAWFSDTFDMEILKTGMVLEGGSIDTNGGGTFLTTESVLLNKNRNPELSKKEIDNNLKSYLGAETIIWLKRGLKGDDTDGHIDDITRFLSKDVILTILADDPGDVNYSALKENYEILKEWKSKVADLLKIVTLPLPKTKIQGTTVDGSEYVPASYANFYIANGVVLVPLYDPRYDQKALDLFKTYFPNRDIEGVQCADLVWGQGSIHCITQQLYGLSL
ncbi:MAG: agmatine deiminase family protein, partial [Balneolaceae bacterium]